MPACGLRCLRMLSYCASGQKCQNGPISCQFLPGPENTSEFISLGPSLLWQPQKRGGKNPSMENEWTSSFFTKTIQYDPIIRSWSFFLFFSSKFWQVNSVNSKHLAVLSISHLESPWRRTNPEQLASTVLVLGWEACTWGNEAGGNTPGYSWTLGRGYGG